MEKIKEEYKEAWKSLFRNRFLVIIVLLVTILSFGFTITNSSIGVDDTAFDRYYEEQEMLSIGRWGAYLLYQLLGLKQFTPFWTDMIASLIVASNAIVWCIFFKKNVKEKLSDSVYCIFLSVFISYPIINEIFIYQNCNIAVVLGNLLSSIAIMTIYENFMYLHKKRIYFESILVLSLSFSMYESCFQIMLLGICIISMLMLCQTRKKYKTKQLVQYILISLCLIIIAVVLNTVIVKGIYLSGITESEAAEKEINWGSYGIGESIGLIANYIQASTVGNIQYFPISIFCMATIIGFVISVVESYKRNRVVILLLFLGMVLSNFAISILQLKSVLYRTCTSWSLFVAIIFMVFYIYMSKYKATKMLTGIWIAILVLQQSRYLTQMFYNDYIRYQRDLHIAYELIDDLETKYDISKPLVIMGTPKKAIGKDGAQVNSLSVLWWGKKAFDDKGYEFIKFLNSLGYQFDKPNEEQYEKGKIEAENMNCYPQEGSIKELEDCIVINF